MIRRLPRADNFSPHRGGQRPLWPFAMNRDTSQAENLLMWLPFPSWGGDSAFDLASYKTGAFQNGLDWLALGEYGFVPSFTRSSSQWINFSGVHFPSPITISLWVYFNVSNVSQCICGEWDNAGNTWLLYLQGTSPPRISLSNGIADNYFASSALTLGGWHHIVFDSAAAQAYLNGVAQTMVGTARTWSSTSNNFQLGKWTSNYLNGAIFDLRIYSGSIGAARAWALYDPKTRWELYRPQRGRVFLFAPPPTADAAGLLTPTGALVKEVRKSVGGAFMPGGALVTNAQKRLSGAMSTAGAESNAVLSGTISGAGTLATAGALIKRAGKLFAGATTTAGSTRTQSQIAPGGALTPTGRLRFLINQMLAGDLSPAGALLNVLAPAITRVSGALSSSGALSTLPKLSLRGALSPAGALSKRVSRAFAGALSWLGLARAAAEEAPCGLTLGDLILRVYERLEEEAANPVYYTRAEVVHALNAAQRLFCLLTLCLERRLNITLLPGQAFYDLSTELPDLLAVLRITNPSNTRVRPARISELDLLNSTWTTAIGTPEFYAQMGYWFFAITPVPASPAVVQVTYAAEPVAMTIDTDIPELAGEHQPLLVDFAIVWLRLKEGGAELQSAATTYLQPFLDAAQKYALFNRARSKAQLYDRLPFDLSSFDRSRLLWKVKQRRKDAA